MITIEETLVVDAAGRAILKLPSTVKPGKHRAVIHLDETSLISSNHPGRIVPKAGCLKGIKMSDDFDAPLEEFRDYTE